MKVTELAVIEPSLLNLAFVLALSAVCLSLPKLSRAAVRCGLVDRPSRRKRHGTSKPFVGGVGLD
jgi:UDP-N-acetylmuramyl pentapeptide phosphotransferase/UDP-N-acetylglucosamine-1-phosphate transferase